MNSSLKKLWNRNADYIFQIPGFLGAAAIMQMYVTDPFTLSLTVLYISCAVGLTKDAFYDNFIGHRRKK